MSTRADYTDRLLKSAEAHVYMTAKGVPADDMNRVTHQIRYQAEKLGLDVHIETDKEALTVSFIARKASNGQHAQGTRR